MNNIRQDYGIRELCFEIIMSNLYDEMILAYKTLILYILKNIKVIDLRKIIWNKIFEEEEKELINQEWYEFELDRVEIEMLKFNLSDLEIQYTD